MSQHQQISSFGTLDRQFLGHFQHDFGLNVRKYHHG